MRAIVIFLLLFFVTLSSAATLPGVSDPVREANRQRILGQWGDLYEPNAPYVAIYGPAWDMQVAHVTAQGALKILLDHLDAQNIDLAALDNGQSEPRESPPSGTTLSGAFQFAEQGFYEEGARCPSVTPLMPIDVFDLYDIQPNQDERLGTVASSVALYGDTVFLGNPYHLHSELFHWASSDPLWDTTSDFTYHIDGQEWRADYYIDYLCTAPRDDPRAKGVVFHGSTVRETAHRES